MSVVQGYASEKKSFGSTYAKKIEAKIEFIPYSPYEFILSLNLMNSHKYLSTLEQPSP